MTTITYRNLDAVAVAVEGDYAYVQGTDTLSIVNIADPNNPVVVGSAASPGIQADTRGVVAVGNLVYVRSQFDLSIYDVSNPASPVLVGDYGGVGGGDPAIHELAVSGGFAYIPEANGTIDIVNVSNPSNPQHVGSYSATSNNFNGGVAWPVAVSGNDLFVADGTQVDAVNVTNPSDPTLLGTCAIAGIPEAIRVSGDYAYVASTTGFYIVDESNPTAPAVVGSYQLGPSPFGFSDVQITGTVAYLLNDNTGQVLKLDITNPQAPTLLDSVNVGAADFSAFVLSGEAALVANIDSFESVNFNATASPSDMSFENVIKNDNGGTIGVSISDNRAFVTDAFSLHVFDTSNPANPVEIGSFGLTDASNVVSDGHFAYVGEGGVGVAIVDVSDPNAIALDATYSFTGNSSDPMQLALDGQYLFATGADDSEVRVINVAHPNNPALVNSIGITAPTALAISGNFAYIGTSSAGQAEVAIYDISDPSAPALVGTYTGGLKSTDHIAVSGHYAYVADDATGLSILDVSNPASPVLVAHYGQSFWDVHIDGDRAYLSGSPGLTELDITNPAAPKLVESITLPSPYANFALDGTDAYVASGALSIIQLPSIASSPSIASIVTSPSTGIFGPSSVITFTVSFTSAVAVASGTPSLTLNDGGVATYDASASAALNDPTKLVFDYTVSNSGSGQNTSDLALAATDAFQLNGAMITDASGTAADLSAANGYNPNGTLEIDTAAPLIGNNSQLEGVISFANSQADTKAGQGVDQTQGVITFTDESDATNASILTTTYNYRDADGRALAVPDATTLEGALRISSFAYASGEGELDWSYALPNDDLLFLQPGSSITVTSAIAIKDAVGNVATKDVSVTIEGDHETSVVKGATESVSAQEGLLSSPSDGGLNQLLHITSVIPDGNESKVAIVQGDSTAVRGLYGTLIVNRDGSYSYVADRNVALPANVDVGQDIFRYTATDGTGLNLTSFLTVSVTPKAASSSPMSLPLPFGKNVHPVVTQYPGQNDHGNASPGNPAPQVDESLYWAIDYAAPEGTQVLAQANGHVLAFVDNLPDGSAGPHNFGNYITIQYDNGIVATYMHLKQASIPENLMKAPDAKVISGKPIGAIGLTGDTTGAHLHVTYGDFTIAFANDPPTTFVPGAHGHGATGIFADGSFDDNNGPPVILPSANVSPAQVAGNVSPITNLNLLVQSLSAGFGTDGFAGTSSLAGLASGEQQAFHAVLAHPHA